MNIVKFPNSEQRKELLQRKSLEESVDIFPDPLRSETLKSLMSYFDMVSLPASMSITAPGGFTESQLSAISEGFAAYNKAVHDKIHALMKEVVDLRFKRATCQMLHGNTAPRRLRHRDRR